MKTLIALFAMLTLNPHFSHAETSPGEQAPSFEAKDADGKTEKLSDYKGKWLVLEWTNKDCPYVKKHYGSGNMQRLQETYIHRGVSWVSVISSAKGKEGYLTPQQALEMKEKNKSPKEVHILLDPTGKMGHDYGAKTSPHMFVINPKGVVVYDGAIDDNDSSDPAVIQKSKNYVVNALDLAMDGKTVADTSHRPYGCSIKY